jgi:hypothetical protein
MCECTWCSLTGCGTRDVSCTVHLFDHPTPLPLLPLPPPQPPPRCIELQEGGSETPQSYIAVACASAYGEDYPALGRVLLLQVVKQHVFQMEGGSQTKVTARLVSHMSRTSLM